LLGLDKSTTAYKMEQQQKINQSKGISPTKMGNGGYVYSKEKKVNLVLNTLANP